MTTFGINPSFCTWSSRLPLFGNPFKRAKMFEKFTPDGVPTGEPSPLNAFGWPSTDGQTWHGVRLYGDMDGTMPEFTDAAKNCKAYKLRINPGNSAFVYWQNNPSMDDLKLLEHHVEVLDRNSVAMLSKFPSKVVRTLDWQLTNKVTAGTEPSLFEGSNYGMSLETQVSICNTLDAHMWWNIPPNYSNNEDVYKERLRQKLNYIKAFANKPVILEYGNELWNPDFPIHHQLTPKWYKNAAKHIAVVKDVAESVFGKQELFEPKKYYLFAGSQFNTIDSTALIITELDALGVTPDIAGPAFYVGPKKEDIQFWNDSGKIPTQIELQHSCYARLQEMKPKLLEHVQVVKALGVPYMGLYECGQSFIAKGNPWREAALVAQRTEWLGSLIKATKQVIVQSKVDIACWYSAVTSQDPDNKMMDVFGFSEGIGKPILPKARALAS